MGTLCSKPGTHSGGHTVLGSNNNSPTTAPALRNETADERRARAAEAAEARMQKVCSSYLIDSQVETTDLGFWAFRSFLGGGSEENITNIILIFVI